MRALMTIYTIWLREFKASVEDDSLRREHLARTGTTGAQVESAWNTASGPIGTPGKPAAPGTVSYTCRKQAAQIGTGGQQN